MNYIHRVIKVPTLALTLCIITACVSTSQPTRLFVLTPLPDDASNPRNQAVALTIASVTIPNYLDRSQIVTYTNKNELNIAELSQWGDNLKKNIVRVLAENLSLLLATQDVTVPPYRGARSHDFAISVSIIRFERAANNRVYLSARWVITTGKRHKPTLIKMSNLVGSEVDALDYAAIVASMNVLLGDLSREIANTIKQLKKS